MVQSGSAETSLRGRIGRHSFPGKCFLHLHTGLQVQWWLMMSTCVLTRLSIPYWSYPDYIWYSIVTYKVQDFGSCSGASSSGSSGSMFIAWPLKSSFLPWYDPSHCPLTQQGHKHRYSHCLAALEPSCPRTSLRLYYEDLVAIIKRSLFFRQYCTKRPRGKILKIPCESAAQCTCAGTYRVRIAPTQRPQRFFENYHYRCRHMMAKAGKG